MEAEAVIDTLPDTPLEEKAKTLGDTIGDVKAQILANTLADTLPKAKVICDNLVVMETNALVDTIAYTLAEADRQTLGDAMYRPRNCWTL